MGYLLAQETRKYGEQAQGKHWRLTLFFLMKQLQQQPVQLGEDIAD